MLTNHASNLTPPKKRLFTDGSSRAKPFLRWAGGKSYLIPQIDEILLPKLESGAVKRYVEPFIGGGAIFFYIAQNHPVEEYFISDKNKELILVYRTLKKAVWDIIEFLDGYEKDYYQLDPEGQKNYYYEIRADYNRRLANIDYNIVNRESILRTSQAIFMNRTCYNGLFRVNSKGKFNVPFGRHKKPNICPTRNLLAVSKILQKTEIQFGDVEACRNYVDDRTLVYLDPPYRPLSRTAHFTSYSAQLFNDAEQQRLALFYRELDKAGALLILSNSDPHNADPTDNFFHDLYREFNIRKVYAIRKINRVGSKRGEISELLITNY